MKIVNKNVNTQVKAVGLFSGGMDSALAIKLIQSQGIDVIALNFVSPFCTCVGKGSKGCSIVELAKKLNVPIKVMNKGMDYIKLVRHPKYGYGKNINPCIDCKMYIFRKAKKFAKEIGAKFLFTGEVLDQRPMSQHYKTLMLIEKEAGLDGKLLRPLSAKLLPITEAEKKGWVDREKLLTVQGRRRIPQLDLAKKFSIDGFMCGGSGCKLTNKEYANKLNDLFQHKKIIGMKDIVMLSFGRHFRFGENKIIVGRNEFDNKKIRDLRSKSDLVFEVKECVGPTTILQGKPTQEAKELAASLTVKYSDSKEEKVSVLYGKEKLNKEISVGKTDDTDLKRVMIT